MDQRLAILFVPQRYARMVFAERDDLMMSHRLRMHCNALGAVVNFHVTVVVANPDLFACILPRHRISTSLPGNVRIPRHFPLLVVHIWIGRPAVHWLHGELILIPADQHLLMRGAVNSLVRYLSHPAAQLGIEIGEIGRFTALDQRRSRNADLILDKVTMDLRQWSTHRKFRRTYFTPDSTLPLVCAR